MAKTEAVYSLRDEARGVRLDGFLFFLHLGLEFRAFLRMQVYLCSTSEAPDHAELKKFPLGNPTGIPGPDYGDFNILELGPV